MSAWLWVLLTAGSISVGLVLGVALTIYLLNKYTGPRW